MGSLVIYPSSSGVLNKLNATAAPAVTDDAGDGYSVSSIWCDISADKAYICLDNSIGAAVWVEITQSGGGTSVSDIDEIRDQIMYLFFKDDAGYSPVPGLFFDSFTDQTGVDDAASTNESYDASGDFYGPSATTPADETSSATITASSENAGNVAENLIDDNTSTSWQGTSANGVGEYVVIDLGAGNAKNIAKLRMINDTGAAYVTAFTLYGSNTGAFGGEEETLTSETGITASSGASDWKEFTFTASATAYRYYKFLVDGCNGGRVSNPLVSEMELLEAPTANNMTLLSENVTAAAEPATGRACLFVEDVDAITINTDLVCSVSRDGGTTWDAVTLAKVATVGSVDQYAADETLTSTGTTMKMKVESANNKDFKLHAWGLSWRD